MKINNCIISAFYFLILIFFLIPQFVFAEEYKFEISETEKKPYHLGGYIEFRPILFGLDKDAALYKLKFYNLMKAVPFMNTIVSSN